MRRKLKVLATAVSTALLACGVAVADTVTTNFEPPIFHLGSVNGQDGWTSAEPGDIPALPDGYDQAVVDVSSRGIAEFGTQSLRHSNAYNEPSEEFHFLTNSKPTMAPAGEVEPNTEYMGGFSFTSFVPDARQPSLYMTMSPDDGEGGRMSAVRLIDDDPRGIRAIIYDTPDQTTGAFAQYLAPEVYSRDEVHTVRFWIKFVPGEDNDIVRVFIDGQDIGNELGVCFTSWENFYRASNQAVPVTRSMIFRAAGGVDNTLVGGGFLFDNVSNTTANGRGPLGCGEERPPIDIDKTTRTQVAQPGDLITYRISVRNRGDAPVRRLRACDRSPRALSFVRSTARLQRAAGRRRCLTIRRLRPGQRRTFRATFRLREDVTAEIVNNGATAETPTGSPAGSAPTPFPPENAVIPEPRRRRVARDSESIVVRTSQRACPAALNPRARAAC